MSELAASQQLCFVVEAMDDPSAGFVAECYQIRQVDQAGNTILSLIVPSVTLEVSVLGQLEQFVSMSPSGEVSIGSDDNASADPQRGTTDIEHLIKHSVSPQMLEDEPEVAAMLNTLKQRLIALLAIVDEAISNLGTQSLP